MCDAFDQSPTSQLEAVSQRSIDMNSVFSTTSTSSGHSLTEKETSSPSVTVSLQIQVPGRDADANATPLEPPPRRGALRFKEVWTHLRAASAMPLFPPAKLRARLPSSRSFSDKPYLRPFSRKPKYRASAAWDRSPGRSLPAGKVALLCSGMLVAGVAVTIHQTLSNHPFFAMPALVTQPVAKEWGGRSGFDVRSQIEKRLREFCNTALPEEKARLIRGGSALLPQLRRYYADHAPETPVETVIHDASRLVETAGQSIVCGLYIDAAGTPRQYAVEVTETGCLLDWRSLTGWTGTDWSGFLEKRPDFPQTFCVSAVPDTLYTPPFASESEWLCLRIEDISRQQPAWAYIRRDSPAARSLPADFLDDSAVTGGSKPKLLTLRLQFPGTAGGRPSAVPLMEIAGVVCDGWFETDLGNGGK